MREEKPEPTKGEREKEGHPTQAREDFLMDVTCDVVDIKSCFNGDDLIQLSKDGR